MERETKTDTDYVVRWPVGYRDGIFRTLEEAKLHQEKCDLNNPLEGGSRTIWKRTILEEKI